MSGDSWQAQRADWIWPPQAGEITVLATSTSVATQDLSLCGPTTPAQTQPGKSGRGLLGHYARFQAVGADVYFSFAPLSATLATISDATTGVNAANACDVIPAGTYKDFLIPDLPVASGTMFIGYKTSAGTGTLRITRTSQ